MFKPNVLVLAVLALLQLVLVVSAQDKISTCTAPGQEIPDWHHCAIFILCKDETDNLDYTKNHDCHQFVVDYNVGGFENLCSGIPSPMKGLMYYGVAWPGADCYFYEEDDCEGASTLVQWLLPTTGQGRGWSSYRCKRADGTTPTQVEQYQTISTLMVPPPVPTSPLKLAKKDSNYLDAVITCGDCDPRRAGDDNTCSTIIFCQDQTNKIDNAHDCHIIVSDFDTCIDMPHNWDNRMSYGVAYPGSRCTVYDDNGCKGDSNLIDWPFHTGSLGKNKWSSFICRDTARSTTLITAIASFIHYSETTTITYTLHTLPATTKARSDAIVKKDEYAYVTCGDPDSHKSHDKYCAVVEVCREETSKLDNAHGCFKFIVPFDECTELEPGIVGELHYAVANPGAYCHFFK